MYSPEADFGQYGELLGPRHREEQVKCVAIVREVMFTNRTGQLDEVGMRCGHAREQLRRRSPPGSSSK